MPHSLERNLGELIEESGFRLVLRMVEFQGDVHIPMVTGKDIWLLTQMHGNLSSPLVVMNFV
jgi:hypothetical protein